MVRLHGLHRFLRESPIQLPEKVFRHFRGRARGDAYTHQYASAPEVSTGLHDYPTRVIGRMYPESSLTSILRSVARATDKKMHTGDKAISVSFLAPIF